MRYRDQPYRDDRNQWRDGPQEFRGGGEHRVQGRGQPREGRQFNDRPREEHYERERMTANREN